MQQNATHPPLELSDDKGRLDLPLIHRFLSEEAYWCRGIPHSTVVRAINHSLCVGGYVNGQQVAFARVITDKATFGYLADVLVLPEYRGRGYSKALVATIVDHPELQGLRRLALATSDAHGLYAGFGFAPPASPDSLMEIYNPAIYQRT
ncbi:GNAT family N-acetyltransferase [Aeromonas veronii]|uniref:GNAT family N-acetyltransferase n=1 Tax=Aeromonas veronii TaxID=654 RepID=UPI001FFE9FA9|nr:GNAT family N-acetyltransferase [Aeromonas veronii]UPK54873.1 GNAT family N-acetyltransferase [Aeromonas veronii]